MKRNRLFFVAGIMLLAAAVIAAAAVPGGADLFSREGCITCHRFRGQGGGTGPDLTAVAERRSAVWMLRQLNDPTVHNPDSRMPSFSRLSFLEQCSLVWYLRH